MVAFRTITLSFYLISTVSGQMVNESNSLKTKAASARAAGRTTLFLRTNSGQEPLVESVDQALEFYTTVTGVVTGSQTYVEPHTELISTWYRMKVNERIKADLSSPAPKMMSLQEWERPETLLPLADNEILVGKNGGTIVIDGVTIVTTETGFAEPKINHTYLIFVSESSDHLATNPMGAAGLYEVQGDELVPAGPANHPVVAGIRRSYGNSLKLLMQRAAPHDRSELHF